jgi:mandelate racemase
MVLPALTIQGIAVRAVDAPLDPPLRNSLNVIPRAPLVIAEVRTVQGVTGNAYVFPYTPAALGPVAALVRNIGAGLAGRSLAPAVLWAELHNNFRILGTEGLVQIALSCLDMALWDTLARAAGVPLCRLLGAEPRPLPIYASLRGWGAAMLAEEAGQSVATLGARAMPFGPHQFSPPCTGRRNWPRSAASPASSSTGSGSSSQRTSSASRAKPRRSASGRVSPWL